MVHFKARLRFRVAGEKKFFFTKATAQLPACLFTTILSQVPLNIQDGHNKFQNGPMALDKDYQIDFIDIWLCALYM